MTTIRLAALVEELGYAKVAMYELALHGKILPELAIAYMKDLESMKRTYGRVMDDLKSDEFDTAKEIRSRKALHSNMTKEQVNELIRALSNRGVEQK